MSQNIDSQVHRLKPVVYDQERLGKSMKETQYKFANLILEAAALKCDEQQLEPECPERASYCAEAIRSMKV